ncbi:hypothetical protein [Alkalicoccus luteus]|uniref:Uncharacterized protein n=1 Tax=Alkalicoccus luteus TaxID=1237094 RepID=A0A969PZM2_9BACI|nr:hypothetical protein [Alkalicoccus luteus]NJP38462.1 hypothetical protein [Alkalicoccus luteus]
MGMFGAVVGILGLLVLGILIAAFRLLARQEEAAVSAEGKERTKLVIGAAFAFLALVGLAGLLWW